MKKMKSKLCIFGMAALLLTSSYAPAYAGDNHSEYLSDILQLQPQISSVELLDDVARISQDSGLSEQEVLEQIYTELKNDQAKAEQEGAASEFQTYGADGGTVIIGPSTKGHFYYTPSYTAYLDHGHVGLYYSSSIIVESVPGDGVRTISANSRKVDASGAVIKSVTTTTANINAAVNWAYGEVGQSYSYNFATNRSTGHNGAKNCSKLIWSAFKLNGNLDLDVDKGLGVYPRDVRDAPDTKLVKNI